MSTKLNDFKNTMLCGPSWVRTAGTTGNTAGASIDMLTHDGPMFGILVSGAAVGDAPTSAVKVQESTDGTTWTDISGATFPNITTAASTATITIGNRTARYVRGYSTTTGTNSLAMPSTLILGGMLKQL